MHSLHVSFCSDRWHDTAGIAWQTGRIQMRSRDEHARCSPQELQRINRTLSRSVNYVMKSGQQCERCCAVKRRSISNIAPVCNKLFRRAKLKGISLDTNACAFSSRSTAADVFVEWLPMWCWPRGQWADACFVCYRVCIYASMYACALDVSKSKEFARPHKLHSFNFWL